MTAAWWSGIVAKSSKPIALERLLIRKERARQSAEEKLAIVQQWAAVSRR